MNGISEHQTEIGLFLLLLAILMTIWKRRNKQAVAQTRRAWGGIYGLSRNMLIAAVAMYAYVITVGLFLTMPAGGYAWLVVLGILAALTKKKKGPSMTAHGTAKWLTEAGAQAAGMLNATRGLILGHMAGSRITLLSRLRSLFDETVPAKDACRAVLGRNERPLVRLPNLVHSVCFAPAGAGKSSALVVPFLLSCEESCVVIDLKGELSLLTALARQKMGHEIIILDPYKVVTQ